MIPEDVVERLRLLAPLVRERRLTVTARVMGDAADEIEALRRELADAKRIIAEMYRRLA